MKRKEPEAQTGIFTLAFSEFQYTVERQFLLIRLGANNWNKMKTAKDLRIQRSHLYNLIAFYKLDRSELPQPNFLDNIFEPEPVILPEFDYTLEIWKVYPKAPFYYISNMGRVKTATGIMLNLTCLSYSYPTVCLIMPDGKSATKYTYRLVAEVFIPNPENKPAVNHINSDRRDSRAINLEWVTPAENTRHDYKNRRAKV